MGTSVSGIFGADPYELAMRRQQQIMSPITQASNPYERIGAALGTALGAGVFGLRDPQLEKATNISNIFTDIMKDVDPTKPEYGKKLTELASTLADRGYGREAAMAAYEANKFRIQEQELLFKQAELGMKRTKAGMELSEEQRKRNKAEQDTIKFYTDNPDQATFELQRLAEQIAADPTNTDALKRYEMIATAGSTGAQKRFAEEEKETLGNAKDRALLAKYKKELEDAKKFGPAERWDAETDAARSLLRVYGIDPNKPLKGQVRTSLLESEIGDELTRAYERALRKKNTEERAPSPVAAAPASAPAPSANDPLGLRSP